MKAAGRRWAGRAVWGLGLLPLAALAVRDLGANPIEAITHSTGAWTLRLLLSTLAVTPLRWGLGWTWLAPQRRRLGLLAFVYASLHFATYLALDRGFDFDTIWEDIAERPYITVGFASFCAMIPLAATSTKATIRRLGRHWPRLHRLVYAAAVGGALHFAWLVKADLLEPLLYASVLALLLGLRAMHAWRSRDTARAGTG